MSRWIRHGTPDRDAADPAARRQRKEPGKVRARFAAANIEADTVLLNGEPADQIVKLADERGVDLIAMSTHGHRFFADLILGSTASKVRHKAAIPVLLLKATP